MLTIGDAAPEFSLPGVHQEAVRNYTLAEVRGKWLVLFFYPADFTFICPTEVVGFRDQIGDFRAEGAEVFGVSVDSVDSHRAWAKELGGIGYPLLGDTEKTVSRAYHVLHPQQAVSLRATFIISPKGVIQYGVACNMNVGRSVEETLRVLRALRTERMCPAGWKAGDPTFDLTHKY